MRKNFLWITPEPGTINQGDIIISRALCDILSIDESWIRISMHQYHPRYISGLFHEAEAAFLMGTNCLPAAWYLPWKIQIKLFSLQTLYALPSYRHKLVSVGCGLTSPALNRYGLRSISISSLFVKTFFSPEFIHSTRDSDSESFLTRHGLKAINTGCPTMWNLPNTLSCADDIETIVVSVTDYRINFDRDAKWLIPVLQMNKRLALFVQGPEDLAYFTNLLAYFERRYSVAKPAFDAIYSLTCLQEFLSGNSVVHVGTRLHLSAYFWNNSRKSLLVSIDNRASSISKNGKFPIYSPDSFLDAYCVENLLLDGYVLPAVSQSIFDSSQFYLQYINTLLLR